MPLVHDAGEYQSRSRPSASSHVHPPDPPGVFPPLPRHTSPRPSQARWVRAGARALRTVALTHGAPLATSLAAHRAAALRRRSGCSAANCGRSRSTGWRRRSTVPFRPLRSPRFYTVLNYLILTGYDQLAFLYIRRPIAKWQIAMASFVGYAIANNVGFALLSGTSARYRFYSRWGLSGGTSRASSSSTRARSGSGCSCSADGRSQPGGARGRLRPGLATRSAGWVLLGDGVRVPGRARSSGGGRCPIGRPEITLPSHGLVLASSCCRRSTGGWPPPCSTCCCRSRGLTSVLSRRVPRRAARRARQPRARRPRRVRVADDPDAAALPADECCRRWRCSASSITWCRSAVALVVLIVDEFYQRRHQVVQWGNAFGTLTTSVAPKLLAVFTLLGGAVLMFSGATPSAAGRRRLARRASCRCRSSRSRISSAASSASGC